MANIDMDQMRRDLRSLLSNEANDSYRKPARAAALRMAIDMLDDPERGHLKPENFLGYIEVIARKLARLPNATDEFADGMLHIESFANLHRP